MPPLQSIPTAIALRLIAAAEGGLAPAKDLADAARDGRRGLDRGASDVAFPSRPAPSGGSPVLVHSAYLSPSVADIIGKRAIQ